jgi:hypothetical protein
MQSEKRDGENTIRSTIAPLSDTSTVSFRHTITPSRHFVSMFSFSYFILCLMALDGGERLD